MYHDEVKEAVKQYVKDEVNLSEFTGYDELEEYLQETLFADDSVTGNASGSYYMNRCKAKEAVLNDEDTVKDALNELCYGEDLTEHLFDWEWLDVIARVYVLSECIADVIGDMKEDGVKLG